MLLFRKFLYYLLIPGGLILPAAIFLHRWSDRPGIVQQLFDILPYLVLATGAFLGWRFNRSRLVLALMALTVADRAMFLAHDLDHPDLVCAAVAFLLPLNFAWIAWIVERGLVSTIGFMRIFGIMFQPMLVDIFLRFDPDRMRAFLMAEPVSFQFIREWGMPQPAIASFLLAVTLLVVRFWFRQHVFEGALLWSLVASMVAVKAGGGDATTFFMTAGGLMLVVAVLEASYFMAFRDELTGLPSRRALNEYLQRTGSRYTVAMVDVDHFKKVNDTYGHDVGDQVLKMVASRLMRVGGGGRAFRYGGEEFTVVFAGRSCDECVPHLENLREDIADAGFTLRSPNRPVKKPKTGKKTQKRPKHLKVTVSIGAAYSDRQKTSADDVVKSADKRLYKAKQGGRNRVVAAS